jgi:hypothetical protein
MKKKKITEIEEFLRSGRLPHADARSLRDRVWQKIVESRRTRRTPKLPLHLPPWIWALASIVLVLLCIIFILMMK